LEIDETDPSANRGFLVQIDAHRANVALARSIRMPYLRPASGMLGTTLSGHAACEGVAARNESSKRIRNGN